MSVILTRSVSQRNSPSVLPLHHSRDGRVEICRPCFHFIFFERCRNCEIVNFISLSESNALVSKYPTSIPQVSTRSCLWGMLVNKPIMKMIGSKTILWSLFIFCTLFDQPPNWRSFLEGRLWSSRDAFGVWIMPRNIVSLSPPCFRLSESGNG